MHQLTRKSKSNSKNTSRGLIPVSISDKHLKTEESSNTADDSSNDLIKTQVEASL